MQLTEVLKALRTERRREALREGKTEMADRVFLTEKGTPMDLSHFRTRVFHRCLEKAGLRRIRIHDVRDQLGHGSIKITVDTYGHLVPGSNKEAVDRLDDGFGAAESAPNLHPGIPMTETMTWKVVK